ncbi:MAG: glycerol-3-phosphate 1-O-acyltransferase PlsY [Candidatus Sumerlaeia bacterium]|nr:glycerol-3-phosphate 1-O-acyltransferase PlsY [Candidatus Sumerlaeia bacterium]
MTWGQFLPAIVIAYLLGAIPFSWLLVRVLKGIDLRTVGSGNLGSTNAMRVLGVPGGLAIQALDILKGWGPVYATGWIAGSSNAAAVGAPAASAPLPASSAMIAVGVAAIVGHMFPVYLKFRGGKGVNTSLGVFLALAPKALLLALAAGLVVLALWRYVSLASMTGAVVFPCALRVFYPEQTALLLASTALAGLIIWLHRSNIRRLLAGTESRLGKKIIVEKTNETDGKTGGA